MEKKRSVAKKLRIFDINNGVFFHGNRIEMMPSYLITPFGEKVSRVNIVAVVTDIFISEDESYGNLTLDDGTGNLRAKFFGKSVELIRDISKGDLVLTVGKLKEYNGEVYVNAEIARKIEDPNFESLRKLEILKDLISKKKMLEEIKNLISHLSEEELKKHVKEKYGMDEESLNVVRENLKVVEEIDYKPKILEIIGSIDKGDGVEISKIFEIVDLPERVIENAISELLNSGDIFEPRPGILKKVKT
ncbi:MAG: OB-fold nucleic acid binding domain-containing protein [Candidatus Aenigmatarchaeota archaeon]